MLHLRASRAFFVRLSIAAASALALVAAAIYGDPGARPAHAAGDCTVSAASIALDTSESQFLVLINNYRAQNGRAPLAASYTLSRAAQWKSSDMAANNYFAHDDLTRTWVARIRDCGYTQNAYIGENIAAGQNTAQSVFDAWKNSPGHNSNMLSANYTAIGIGLAYVPGSPYGYYWTNEFASINDGWVTVTQPSSTATRTSTPAPPTATRTAVAPTATPTKTPPAATPTSTIGTGDVTAPTVSLSANRQSSDKWVRISVSSSDAVGVVRTELFINGARVATSTRSAYTYVWWRYNAVPGTYVVVARAYDAAGNAGERSLTLQLN